MSGLQIMQIMCPDYMAQNFLQLWYSLLSLETKMALKDNLFWFQTDCATGISRAICLSSLIRMGPSTCPNRRYRINFGSQTFASRGHLSLWICIERSWCLGLREYLSGWVDLVGKPPSPRSFTCWCFGPLVFWSLVHFVSWLVTSFMIFS
jgi:hypothetical protein